VPLEGLIFVGSITQGSGIKMGARGAFPNRKAAGYRLIHPARGGT
jgi:hypothetical protein